MDRERTEETINERGKKIIGVSQDPHQKKKVFKENRSKNKVYGKYGEEKVQQLSAQSTGFVVGGIPQGRDTSEELLEAW